MTDNDTQQAPVVRVNATLPQPVLERLDAWLSDQDPAPSRSGTIAAALRIFLDLQGVDYTPPAWTPTCPKCGCEAFWLRTSELGVVCKSCHHYGFGAYPSQAEEHAVLAEAWGGGKEAGNV